MSCDKGCTPEVLDLAFKKAEQFIDNEILKRVPKLKKFWVDYFPVKTFPDGAGLKLDKVRLHLDPGPYYDGYDGWRTVEITRPANTLEGANDGCAFRPELVGHGLETLQYNLMVRDFETNSICLKDIRTFFQYKQIQDAIFQNLSSITGHVREQLARNAALSFAVKHVAIPGLPYNVNDPYTLPNLTGVSVGRLNERLLKRVYDLMVGDLDEYALSISEGMPVFGAVAHPDTIDDLFYEDPAIREDLRFSSMTDDLLKSYGIISTFRNMFVFLKDWHAPRYKTDALGNLVRVFPRERNVPIEIGTRSVSNPEYTLAPYELVLFLTKSIGTFRTRKALESVGGKTQFGPEPDGLMGEWKWFNPETCDNAFKRVGKYITSMEVGVEPGDAPTAIAVLVARRPEAIDIQFWPAPECPPTGVCPTNELPPAFCPCALVIGICETVNSNQLLFTFDKPITEADTDPITLLLSNGSTVTGEVISGNTDRTKIVIEFTVDVTPVPGLFVSVVCTPLQYPCSSASVAYRAGASADLEIVTLAKAIRCQTDNDDVTVYFGDGSSITAELNGAADLTNNEWTLDSASAADFHAYACAHGGIVKVCCVPTQDNGCPACDGETEPCVDPIL